MVRRTLAIVGMIAVTGAAACGSSSSHRSSIAQDRATAPSTIAALLAPFHLDIQRWSIEPRAGEQPTSYELSIYSRPASTQSPDIYAGRFAPLAARVIPAAFAKYPDIGWIDLCQERAGTPSSTWEPQPVTRIEISRGAARAIDWAHATVADLLTRNVTDDANVQIETHDNVARTQLWKTAAAQARSRAKKG